MSAGSSIRRAREEWERDVLGPHLQRHPPERSSYTTGSGTITVDTLYTPEDGDAGAADYLDRIGFPGSFPFTRGVRPGGHRTFPWRLGYYAGFGDARETNQRLRKLIEGGAAYANIAFDLPTQCGYDPDHPLAADDVGKVGVSMSSAEDMEVVFDGIDLRTFGTGTVGNCIGPMAVGLFTHAARAQGLDGGEIRVILQNDPLKEFTGRGTQIVPIEPSLELAADVTEFCLKHRKRWIPQYACTTQLRWGGVTAAQEIAFGAANFACYLDALLRRGIEPSVAVPRMEGIHMTADNDLFEEVAKFRAMRRLWAHFARERYRTDDPGVLGVQITVFTGAHRLTSQEPLNNITRTTVHVLAALLGGADRLTIPAYDEALALPTEQSTRVANLTKMILLREHNVGHTVDPLGGSYYVERLTDELEEQAWEILREVQERGGAVAAIDDGMYEKAMVDGLYADALAVESGRRTVVGVNEFVHDEPTYPTLFRTRDEYRSERIAVLADLRRRRDSAAVTRAAAALRETLTAKRGKPTLNATPQFIECVEAKMTMGEIAAIMREVFGEA